MENIKQDLVEDTTGPAVDNIATTDENIISAQRMFQETKLPSLGRQIFPVVEVNGPTGAIFNARRKPGTNDLELVRSEVEVFPSQTINTSITQEAIEDIKTRFGKKARNVIGTLLRGLANDQENARTLAFLDAESLAETALTLTDSQNAETIAFEVTQKVNELVIKANSKALRTYESYCVLPYAVGASFAALNNYVGGEDLNERGLFLAKVGTTSYYLNTDATSTTAYVGLLDKTNPSRSAAIFSPYIETIQEATDPDSGEVNMFIFNRFAITASPLHDTDNEMMFKFDINL